MDALQTVLPILLKSSIAALVLADGLDAGLEDVLYLVRRPARLGRAILAVSVIVPLAAVLVAQVVPLSVPAKVGVILMALAPVPPLLPRESLKLGGRKSYVLGLYATFSALAVLTVPVTVAALNRFYGTQVKVPEAALSRMMLAAVLAPLVAGVLIRAARPQLAERVALWMGAFSQVLLLTALAAILFRGWRAIADMLGTGTVVGIAVISLAALVGGHILGGPDPRDRIALAATAATRHPAVAMMIADANFVGRRVDAAIAVYLIVSVAVVAVYPAVLKRVARNKLSGEPP